jgi:D-inositol-3-phosphate glycosyltransferase
MKKLLWVGDAACPSGFAKATHEILDTLRLEFAVTVLGLNYRGDPHSYPYPIYAAMPGGDLFGLGRLIWMCDLVKPDVIVIQNDPWNFPTYLRKLQQFEEYKNVPVIGAVAVDGKNCGGKWLNGLSHAIFWTEFGRQEAIEGGYEGPSSVIPLGVDRRIYKPMDRRLARKRRGLESISDAFIVGNVNRNQPRKRWDLCVKYFAQWVKQFKIDNAYLYLHTAPTGDTVVDVKDLAKYYGVIEKLALMEPPTWYGIDEEDMSDTYNSFDVCVTTTQGEGMGLTTLEAMACGVPCIVPQWAALGDWARVGAVQIPCTTTAVGPPYVNVIGGIPDEEAFVHSLQALYESKEKRDAWSGLALDCSNHEQFSWENVGHRWLEVVERIA